MRKLSYFFFLLFLSCENQDIIEPLSNGFEKDVEPTVMDDKWRDADFISSLSEHSRKENNSFIVFFDDTKTLTKNERLFPTLKGDTYSQKTNLLRNYYVELLGKLGITGKIGRAFVSFNGIEISMNERELSILLDSELVTTIEINYVFNADLPKIENFSGQNSETVPPGVQYVTSPAPGGSAISGKTAWVLDTGCDLDHPDLNIDQVRSISFIPGETSADDLHGHGTHVAGIIGAKRNNQLVVGVAPNAKIVAVKVLNYQGGGTFESILAGLDYVDINATSYDVVNMSIGFSSPNTSTTLDNKIKQIADKNVQFVIAAGNYKSNTSGFPLARIVHPYVDVVGAMSLPGGHFATNFPSSTQGSNWGSNIVVAPGVNILSTTRNGGMGTMTGTSQAAPHISGIYMYKKPSCDCPCTPWGWHYCILTPPLFPVNGYPYSGTVPISVRIQQWFYVAPNIK